MKNSKNFKRIISFALTILLIISMVSMSAFNAFAATTTIGTSEPNRYTDVGGVVGVYNNNIENYYNIKDSYPTGTFSDSSDSKNIGGMVGLDLHGMLENYYNTGTISACEYGGGMAGSTMEDCYKPSTSSGSEYVSGMVDDNRYGTLDKAYPGGINGKDVKGSLEAKIAEPFASGEFAYLLQGEMEDHIWGQKIGTE